MQVDTHLNAGISQTAESVRGYYHRASTGDTNFGDDLNALLLPRIFPGISVCGPNLSDCPTVVLGFGTILNVQTRDSLAHHQRKFVFSSGYGYDLGKTGKLELGADWDVRCVRGPLTAMALGLDANAAVTDGAMLAARLLPQAQRKEAQPAFMPHITTARHGREYWEKLCARLGVTYLDPRDPIDALLEKVASAAFLLTEAMHGAILADAYRTPWIALSICDVLPFKWQDWCASLGLEYRPVALPPVWPDKVTGLIGRTKLLYKTQLIERQLSRLLKDQPMQLSSDVTLSDRLDELEDRAATLRSVLSCKPLSVEQATTI